MDSTDTAIPFFAFLTIVAALVIVGVAATRGVSVARPQVDEGGRTAAWMLTAVAHVLSGFGLVLALPIPPIPVLEPRP